MGAKDFARELYKNPQNWDAMRREAEQRTEVISKPEILRKLAQKVHTAKTRIKKRNPS